jgi:hypothetical protein
MALAKLFRVTDSNDQRWHVAAASFSAAVELMKGWEGELSSTPDDEVVRSVEAVEDLILGGTRDDSLSNYEVLGFHPVPHPATDWALADQLAEAAIEMLKFMPPAPHGAETDMAEYIARIKKLRDAAERYQEVPW